MESEDIDLQNVDFHANWKLENTSKSFKSLKQSITEHQEDTKSFTIELLLFESYLYMSDFKGNDEKDIAKAKEINEEAFRAISELPDKIPKPIKDGYKSIYLALKCWLTTNQRERKEHYRDLKILLTEYQGSVEEDKRKFQASVHATKGFALSRLKYCRYKESETELEKATEICPDNVEWKFMLGLITWRRYTNINKFEWSDELKRTKKIMNEVLEVDADHAYAKAILADIYRRKYERHSPSITVFNQDFGHSLIFKNVEDPRIIAIMKLLKEAKEGASRPKILSLIAQCYIPMGDCICKRIKGNDKECSDPKYDSVYFRKAHEIIEYAKEIFSEAACIFVQEAILYREKNETYKQLECLENAIRLQPSDVGAKMQKAKALLSLGKHEDASAVYDNLLSDFKDDPFVKFDVNQNYARFFISIKQQYDQAIFRNQECLRIALESFVKNSPGPIEFIDEQQSNVAKVITYLKKHFDFEIRDSKGRDKVQPTMENAQLHEDIGDFEKACSYYEDALDALKEFRKTHTNQDQELLTKIRLKIAKVNLEIGNLDDCRKMLDRIRSVSCTKKQEDLRQQVIMDLLVAEGEKAAESGDKRKAIEKFTQSTKMESLIGAKRLLEETKKTDDTELRMSALKSIASVAKGNKKWTKEINLKQELAELLPSSDDGSLMGEELKALRKCQLEMEYSILMDDDDVVDYISTVLQKGRNILNHAMQKFGNKHGYPVEPTDSSTKPKIPRFKSLDFIIIRNTDHKSVVRQMRDKLKRFNWTGFETKFKLLFDYFVSIQPATNSKFEWLKYFSDYNNKDKHECALENSEKTITVVRDMCSNIEGILDEMYKWY